MECVSSLVAHGWVLYGMFGELAKFQARLK